MLPIALNLTTIDIGLAGRGAALLKRLQQLDENGATKLQIFCDQPDDAIIAAAGDRLNTMLPTDRAIEELEVLMVAGLPEDKAGELAETARRLGTLVNVEDVKHYCDFYFMSTVTRGDLQIAIGTNGASPGLAVALREYLEARLGAEWTDHVEALRQLRETWRAQGKAMPEVLSLTKQHIADQGWLPPVDSENKKQ